MFERPNDSVVPEESTGENYWKQSPERRDERRGQVNAEIDQRRDELTKAEADAASGVNMDIEGVRNNINDRIGELEVELKDLAS